MNCRHHVLLDCPFVDMGAVCGSIVQQGHLPGFLDFSGELALMFGAGPGDSAGDDLAPVGDEIPEQVYIFIVQINILICAKATEFFSGREFSECHLFLLSLGPGFGLLLKFNC
jgi:hypothetical protein